MTGAGAGIVSATFGAGAGVGVCAAAGALGADVTGARKTGAALAGAVSSNDRLARGPTRRETGGREGGNRTIPPWLLETADSPGPRGRERPLLLPPRTLRSIVTLSLAPRKRCWADAGAAINKTAIPAATVMLARFKFEMFLIGRRRIMSPNPLYFLASTIRADLRTRTYRTGAETDNSL